MMNFADAPEPVSLDIIPEDTLLWVQIKVRPKNLATNMIECENARGSKWLDVELTARGGGFEGRKIWDMILTHHAEGKGVQGGAAAIKAILECNGAHPDRKESYGLPTYMHLDGLMAAIKVKIEPAEPYRDQQGNQHPGKAKNRVGTWLSPYATSTSKNFHELMQLYQGQRPNPKQAPHEQAPPAGHPAFAAPPVNGPQDYGMPVHSTPAPAAPPPPPTWAPSVPAAPTAPAPTTPPVQHNNPLPWAAAGSGPSNWGR